MLACNVPDSVELGSNDLYDDGDGDENNPRIHMQVIFVIFHF